MTHKKLRVVIYQVLGEVEHMGYRNEQTILLYSFSHFAKCVTELFIQNIRYMYV